MEDKAVTVAVTKVASVAAEKAVDKTTTDAGQGLICTPAVPRQDVYICFCSRDAVAVDKVAAGDSEKDNKSNAVAVNKDAAGDSEKDNESDAVAVDKDAAGDSEKDNESDAVSDNKSDDTDDDPTYKPPKKILGKRKKRKWGRCRAPPLSAQELHLLTEFNEYKCPFVFTERCMKEYKQLQSSPLHLNARNLFSAAIGQVVKQAKDDVPAEGNVKVLFARLFPLCVKVFDIPPSGAREVHASPEAVQKLIDDDAYTYHDCAKYPEVCCCIPNNDSNIC